MAITKIFQNNRFATGYTYRVAETVEDVKALKTGLDELGSEIYIIEKNQLYISNGKGSWFPKNTDGETIVCDCVEESTIWNNLPEPTEAN